MLTSTHPLCDVRMATMTQAAPVPFEASLDAAAMPNTAVALDDLYQSYVTDAYLMRHAEEQDAKLEARFFSAKRYKWLAEVLDNYADWMRNTMVPFWYPRLERVPEIRARVVARCTRFCRSVAASLSRARRPSNATPTVPQHEL